MKIHNANYVISAPSLKECPDFEETPELVLVGRSNVGKSSFINSMLQRKNLARTSNTPGKTRYINFYDIFYEKPSPPKGTVERMIFVDLPGYGYAKVSKTEQEKWRKNLEAYLLKRDAIRLVFQMIDARHGPQENDIQMYEWLQYHGREVQIILTKADKVTQRDLSKQVSKTAQLLDVTPPDVILYSAENHRGRDKAWEKLLSVLGRESFPNVAPEVAEPS